MMSNSNVVPGERPRVSETPLAGESTGPGMLSTATSISGSAAELTTSMSG